MLLIVSSIVAALMTVPAVLPGPGSSATYHYVFRGHFWNGAVSQADRNDTLDCTADTIRLSKHDRVTDSTTVSSASIRADGTASLNDANVASDPFAPYNAVALLVHGAPSYGLGTMWKTSTWVQTGQTAADLTQVPIQATVVSIDGDLVTVQGSGAVHATSTYGEYKDPIDLTVQMAARFRAGQLQRADYQATEYVHAGPLSQTMNWAWSLSIQPS